MNEIKDRLVQIATNMQKIYAAGQIQGVLPENLPVYTGSSDGWGYELHIIAEKLLDVYNAGINGITPEEGMIVYITTYHAGDPYGYRYTITNGDKEWNYYSEYEWGYHGDRNNPYDVIRIDNTKSTTIRIYNFPSADIYVYNGESLVYALNPTYNSEFLNGGDAYTIPAGVTFDEIHLSDTY